MTSFKLATIAYLLNLFDMAATLFIVGALGGREINPLMGAVLAVSPFAFVCAKTFGTGLLLSLLDERKAVMPLAVIVLAYSAIAIGHIVVIGAAL